MKIIKKTSGTDESGFVKNTAAEQRRRAQHGSTNKHGMAVAGGTLRRMKEKPGLVPSTRPRGR